MSTRRARPVCATIACTFIALWCCAGAPQAAFAGPSPPLVGSCDTNEWARPARASLRLAERAGGERALEYLQAADEDIAEGGQTMIQTAGCNDPHVLAGFDLLAVWSRVLRGGRAYTDDRAPSACKPLHLAAWRVYLARQYAVLDSRRGLLRDDEADVAHVVALAQAQAAALGMAALPDPTGGGPPGAAAAYSRRYALELGARRAAAPKNCIPQR